MAVSRFGRKNHEKNNKYRTFGRAVSVPCRLRQRTCGGAYAYGNTGADRDTDTEPTATPEPEKDQADLLKTFAATIEQSYAKTNMRATVNVEGNTIEMLLTLDGLNAAVAEMKTNGDYSTWNTMKESLSGTADSIRKTGEAIGLTDFVLKVTLYDDKTALPLVSWTDGEQTYDLVGD